MLAIIIIFHSIQIIYISPVFPSYRLSRGWETLHTSLAPHFWEDGYNHCSQPLRNYWIEAKHYLKTCSFYQWLYPLVN